MQILSSRLEVVDKRLSRPTANWEMGVRLPPTSYVGMKDIKKKKKKRISVDRRDLWDRYDHTYRMHLWFINQKFLSDTGGIRKGKRKAEV